MKTRRCLFYFILLSLLCAITTLSESAPGGICEVGDVIQRGERCTYPGTNDVFSVDAAGNARFMFATVGGNLIFRDSIVNGKLYTLVTEHSAGGGRRITELGGTTAPPQPVSTEPKVRVVDPDSPPIYWTDGGTDKIQRVNLDGSNIEDLVTGLVYSQGIALDVAGGKMYWTDGDADKIQRANLDGSDVEDLVTQGLEVPFGIALDVAGGKMYWTDFDTDKIQRANLDGSNVEDLITQGYIHGPRSIALDIASGKMYWIDLQLNKIQRANLDGSNVEDLITRGLETPLGIALDVVSGKMYWTDRGDWKDIGTGKIQRANFDGSNVENLITQGLDDPDGIALDVVSGKMYWTDFGTQKIQRANFDGSNVEDLITGLQHPGSIALGIPSQATPISATVQTDVNDDGVVDVQDLVLVAQRYGQTGTNAADVNEDGIVNIDDLILVAAAIDADAAAAPSLYSDALEGLTVRNIKLWLSQARQRDLTDPSVRRGILFLEQLLASMVPKETMLLANYPNPFNPETWIPYQLAKPAEVTLTIYGIDGQVVRQLALGHQPAGVYQNRSRAAYWDGRNAFGEKVASGLYFYTFTAGEFSATRKMLIQK